MTAPWWRGGVVYQIYPRSFADSNGDGVGDLPGIVDRLEYLEWLGVDGIWLNPVHPSPNRDWGYDVSDYYGVHPELGTEADLERLIAEARSRGIHVLLDLVPAHTSDRHAWFADARGRRDAPRRDWYLWADPAPDGSPPTDQQSTFGGPAWTLDEASGQYYHHAFLPQQPDLNWLNPQVRDAFDEVFRHWFDRGVAGFRVDVVHELVKDALGNVLVPEIHDVLRRWRTVADAYDPPRLLVGETWVNELERLVQFYGRGDDQLDLAFNFPFLFAGLGGVRHVVERMEQLLPGAASPVWALSNHDVVRFPTRMCEGDDARVRCALLILLTLRGTSFLYYGDELGMRQAAVPPERVLDVDGRDGARAPMPWDESAWRDPWLPLGGDVQVAAQREDPGSTLAFARALVQERRRSAELRAGAYSAQPSDDGTWVWRRGERVVVAANPTADEREASLPAGVVRVATRREREGDEVADRVGLAPWEGLVVETR